MRFVVRHGAECRCTDATPLRSVAHYELVAVFNIVELLRS